MYQLITSVPKPNILHDIIQLHEQIFGESKDLLKRMQGKDGLLFVLAVEGEKIIGYKIGYEQSPDKFYSWLGGVDKNYRNQGIATKLMEKQHQYLIEHGYTIVQTKTKNKWRNILILNLKSGFDVIETYTNEKGESKIILEKKLTNRSK